LGQAKVEAFLARHRRIAIDTSVFIYELEEHPRYRVLTHPVFSWIEQTGHAAVTSTVTMTELLVLPYREDDEELLKFFYGLLSTYPNLQWIPPDLEIADIAAKVRALHRLHAIDALQAATAVKAQATGLITNDPLFERIDLYETLVLDRLL
jgi:predicted nucleic acid-binding protein